MSVSPREERSCRAHHGRFDCLSYPSTAERCRGRTPPGAICASPGIRGIANDSRISATLAPSRSTYVPANKNTPATAIVRRQRAYRSATLREFNWRAWKPDLPSSSFRFGRVPLMHSADRALRGDGDMKSRFALALLASVAVIAAMATDASAAGHGGGGGGGHGGGGGGFHGGGGGGFHMGGGGGFHAMGGGGLRMGGGGLACRRQRLPCQCIPQRQFRRAARGQRARICGAQFWRRRLLPSGHASPRVQRIRRRAAALSGAMPACAHSAIRTRNLARTALLSAEPPASAQARP